MGPLAAIPLLERELCAGGMATVYLAEDLKHRRKMAIKVLRPELAATIGPERFAREIAVAARLQHPHILGLLDSGNADGFFYYVMPYVEGRRFASVWQPSPSNSEVSDSPSNGASSSDDRQYALQRWRTSHPSPTAVCGMHSAVVGHEAKDAPGEGRGGGGRLERRHDVDRVLSAARRLDAPSSGRVCKAKSVAVARRPITRITRTLTRTVPPNRDKRDTRKPGVAL